MTALSLVQYFDMSRGTGHTRTVVKGLARELNALVIVDSHEDIPTIPAPFKIPLNDLKRRLAGRRDPIVIDNHALVKLLLSLLWATGNERNERHYAETMMASVKNKLNATRDRLLDTQASLIAAEEELRLLNEKRKKHGRTPRASKPKIAR
jgi:hypothetical protein